jgi:hypothetical protein
MDKRSPIILSIILYSLGGCDGSSLDGEKAANMRTVEDNRFSPVATETQKASAYKYSTEGFHHIKLDHRECLKQYSSTSLSIPIPTDSETSNFPTPSGFPLSPTIGNQPTCTPDVQRKSINATNGLLEKKTYLFDHVRKNWIEQQITPDSKIQLSDDGSWITVSDTNTQIAFNNDDTATTINGNNQQTLSIKTADLSEKPLSFAIFDLKEGKDGSINTDNNTSSATKPIYDDLIARTTSEHLFPQGAKIVHRVFKQINDAYEISVLPCPANSNETYNGNCNIIRKPDSTAATSIDANMFFGAESSQAGTQNSMQIGSLKIQLMLSNEQASDFASAHSGPVRFIQSGQSAGSDALIKTGEWIKTNIRGVEFYLIEVPPATHNNQASHIFITEQNGYVRQGTFNLAGETRLEQNWHLSNEALESFTSLLQSL